MEKGWGSRRSRAVGKLRQAHCDKSAAKRSKTRQGRLREQCWRRVCRAFERGASSRRQEAVPTAGGQKEAELSQAGGWIRGRSQGLGVVDIARERQRRALCDLYTTTDGRLRKLDETASEQGSGSSGFAGKSKAAQSKRKRKQGDGIDVGRRLFDGEETDRRTDGQEGGSYEQAR